MSNLRVSAILAAVSTAILIVMSGSASAVGLVYMDSVSIEIGTYVSGNVASLHYNDTNAYNVSRNSADGSAASTLTAYPIIDGSETWARFSCIAGSYQCVDDVTPDGNATYVTTDTADAVESWYLTNVLASLPAGSITATLDLDVTVRRNTSSPASVNLLLYIIGGPSWPAPCGTMTRSIPSEAFVNVSWTTAHCAAIQWDRTNINDAYVGVQYPDTNTGPVTVTSVTATWHVTQYFYLSTTWFSSRTFTGNPSTLNVNCAAANTTASNLTFFRQNGTFRVALASGACGSSVTATALPGDKWTDGRVHFLIGVRGCSIETVAFDRVVLNPAASGGPVGGMPDIMGTMTRLIGPVIFVAIVIVLVILAYQFRKKHGGL